MTINSVFNALKLWDSSRQESTTDEVEALKALPKKSELWGYGYNPVGRSMCNQQKRYLHVKDDNTLALSDEPKSSMRKVANYMYNYAAKLGQNLTPKEQEKVSKIRENLGKMLSRYKEKEKDFLNSKGFFRRVLYSVCPQKVMANF